MQICELSDNPDESLRALGIMLDAWDQGAEDGVAPELMAYAALFTALTDLVGIYGEVAVAAMARGLVGRIEKGEFTSARSLQ
jgi:hypothetical protein